MPSPSLEITDLSVHYGAVKALEPFSLLVPRGELVLILGPNGAGKTSLVKALAGSAQSTGRVRVKGRDISALPAYRRVRAGIALVPEGRGPLPGLTVLDNLHLAWRGGAAENAGQKLPGEEMDRVTTLFPILKERLPQDCSTLSGGQMQMLAIARAMLARPEIMLLDEPSLGLAPAAVATAYKGLAALNMQGLSMVIVEQKSVPLWREPDVTIVLKSGQVLRRYEDQRPADDELADLYLGAH